MSRKLIVHVLRLRENGRAIPKYQLAFATPIEGVLQMSEERIAELNRHALVARLVDATTGNELPVNPLIDARMVRAMSDEWIITGFERTTVGVFESDCAQSWIARLARIQEQADL